MPTLTKEITEAAIAGFEVQKQRLDAQIAELRTMLNGAVPATETKTRRKMSPATLRRMREGQKRRWAKVKGEHRQAESKAPKPKRRLSAAGKAAIIAALKKRWAAKKAGETLSAPAPKKAARQKAG